MDFPMVKKTVDTEYRETNKRQHCTKLPFRIFLKLLNEDDGSINWLVVEIPNHDLEPHRAYDRRYYCLHNHDRGNPQRFREISSRLFSKTHNRFYEYGCALLGSDIYTFDAENCELLRLDAAGNQTQLEWITVPKPFLLSTRFSPIPVAMGGRLYILGATCSPPKSSSSFGVIYDPLHGSWTDLDTPLTEEDTPLTQEMIRDKDHVLAMCLGDSILVVGPHPHIIERLPVGHRLWNPFTYGYVGGSSSQSFKDAKLPKLVIEAGSQFVSVEEEKTLYWIDVHGFFCAYRWDTKVLVRGPIVGLEKEKLLDLLLQGRLAVPLLRLERDLFCLTWTSYDPLLRTFFLHYSIAGISWDHRDPSFPTMFVVGCFREPLADEFFLLDAFLL